MAAPMSGRRAQAARNDELILDAAREVFVADPSAPIAAVAERAGVGISALYRRHGSKEDLLRRLCADGLRAYLEVAARAVSLADPWDAFAAFVSGVVDADTHALTMSLAGTFTPTPELESLAVAAGQQASEIVDRAHASGVLRPDFTALDLGLVFEQLSSVRGADAARTSELRARFVALLFDGLRLPASFRPLPGPAPQPGEFAGRWEKRA